MLRTRLYHASVAGGPSGVTFRLGDSTVFAPMDDDRLYLIDPALLIVREPVPSCMAAFLAETIIEPRLAQIGGAA
jgi:hypothetical protein